MSSHRSANGIATDDSPVPVAHRTIEAKISRGWSIDVRVVVHDRFSRTRHRCPLRRRQMRMPAGWTSDDSDGTTRLIMIENVDDCWDVVARADV